MAVEKINGIQQVQITPITEKPEIKEEERVIQNTGSSKNVVTALSVLAALGAAGVAIYKHKNTKKAVEEAENAAKKKIEEAEAKAKQAAEDTEKKIQEAVDKVKQEYEKLIKKTPEEAENKSEPVSTKKVNKKKNKNKNNTEKVSGTTDNEVQPRVLEGKILDNELEEVYEPFKKRVQESENGIIVVPESTRLSRFISDILNSLKKRFKKKEKPVENIVVQPKAPEIKPEQPKVKTVKPEPKAKEAAPKQPENKPAELKKEVTEEVINENPAIILEGGIKDTDLDVVDKTFRKQLRESENGIIVIPSATKLSEFVQKTTDNIKEGFAKFKSIFKKKEKPAEEIIIQPKVPEKKTELPKTNVIEQEPKTEEAVLQQAEKKVVESKKASKLLAGIVNALKKRFEKSEKPAERVIVPPKTPEKRIELPKANVIEQEPKTAETAPKSVEQKFDVPEKKDIIAEKADVSEEKIKNQIVDRILNIATEEQLLTEYNRLKSKVADKTVTSLESKVFLAIKGELFNHRDYRFEGKEQNPIKRIKRVVIQKIKAKPHVQKTLQELKEGIAQAWRNDTQSITSEYEQRLNGNILVQVPKKPTNIEHKRMQAEYDKLAIKPERKSPVQKTLQELKEGIARAWRNDTQSITSEYEQRLNGNILVNVPQKPTNIEHKRMQAEYDKLAIKPERKSPVQKTLQELKEGIARAWKNDTQTITSEYEQRLNGNISVHVPQKPTNIEHKRMQAEYDKLAIKPERKSEITKLTDVQSAEIVSDVKSEETQTLINGQLSIQPIRSYQDTDQGVTVVRNVVKGLNDKPESFNETERNFVKYAYDRKRQPKDKVTEYPKLYSSAKEEKAAKKEYKKAKKEHIERRVNEYSRHAASSDEQTAITNSYMITNDMKFSARKYKSMEKERPTAKDWEVEMTRADFMKNKEQYMQENFRVERQTNGVHNFTNQVKPLSIFERIKNFFGF